MGLEEEAFPPARLCAFAALREPFFREEPGYGSSLRPNHALELHPVFPWR